jgi:DNA-binding response OmpR family regulator/REP element-mobilizing transposase RayT
MALRVLIIDPEISFIVRLRKALEAQHFTARTVRRPLAAIDDIQSDTFDIAVLDLEIDELQHIYDTLRHHHPTLPVIISGRSEKDAEMVNQLGAQAYINKPYIARNLIAIIEWTLARLEAEPMQRLIDQFWEDVQAEEDEQLPRLQISEPPLPEESTIGDILRSISEQNGYAQPEDEALDDEATPTSQPTPPPHSLPESTAALRGPIQIDEPPISPEDSVASQVLRLSSNAEDADRVLIHTASAIDGPTVRPLPSWQTALSQTEEDLIRAVIGIVPDSILPPQQQEMIEGTPYTSGTRPIFAPPVDLQAEHDADELEEADTGLQLALQNLTPRPEHEPASPEDDVLIEATPGEITHSMGIVLDDDDETDSADAPSDEDIVADAALRLTQLSLESSALGTLLTDGTRVVGKNGDLNEQTWRDIIAEVIDAWQTGESNGQSSTRLLYRKFKATGQVLLFSTQTVQGLVLTMIFSASTALKVIRRQATRIADALETMPEEADTRAPAADDTDDMQDAIPTEAPAPPAPSSPDEAPAAVTAHSRPTDLRPPDAMRGSAASTTQADRPRRDPGTYTGYAMLWLVLNQDYPLEGELAAAMERWLHRSATEQEWDIIAVDIHPGWVNMHIEIPVNTSPAVVVSTLMAYTTTALHDAFPDANGNGARQPLWSESYSVMTPGRLMEDKEIERFIRFYTHS